MLDAPRSINQNLLLDLVSARTPVLKAVQLTLAGVVATNETIRNGANGRFAPIEITNMRSSGRMDAFVSLYYLSDYYSKASNILVFYDGT